MVIGFSKDFPLSYVAYCILRFLNGIFMGANRVVLAVYAYEIVPTRDRPKVSAMYSMSGAFGKHNIYLVPYWYKESI